VFSTGVSRGGCDCVLSLAMGPNTKRYSSLDRRRPWVSARSCHDLYSPVTLFKSGHMRPPRNTLFRTRPVTLVDIAAIVDTAFEHGEVAVHRGLSSL
jgi:hypothetical protein